MPFLYPVFRKASLVVPISTAEPKQYPSFPFSCVLPASGPNPEKKLTTFKNFDGVTAASHTAGGATWISRDNAAPVLLFDSGDCPVPVDTFGDSWTALLPNGNVLLILSREDLTRADPRHVYSVSTDRGATFPALTNLPKLTMFNHATPVDLFFDFLPSADGTKLFATAYGKELGNTVTSVALLESTDGINWSLRSWIRRGSDPDPRIDETCLVRWSATKLMACGRDTGNGTGLVFISNDEGLTWGAPITLAAAAGYVLPLNFSGYPYGMNWQGQRGFKPAGADNALIFGRANGGAFQSPGDRGTAIYWYAVDGDGKLIDGPVFFEGHEAKWGSFNYDGGYQSVSVAGGGADVEVWSFTIRDYVACAGGFLANSPALLRYTLDLYSTEGGSAPGGGGVASEGTMIRVSYRTGVTVYATLRSEVGQWWNDTLQAFEDFNSANWADYALLVGEVGNTGVYEGDPPAAAVTAGATDWIARLQVGVVPDEDADANLADGSFAGVTLSTEERQAIAAALATRVLEGTTTWEEGLRGAVADMAGEVVENPDGSVSVLSLDGTKERVKANFNGAGLRTEVLSRDLT